MSHQYTLIYTGAKFHVYAPFASSECYEHTCLAVENIDDTLMIVYMDEEGKIRKMGADICHLAGECPKELQNADGKLPEIINDKYPALRALRRALSVSILGHVGFSGNDEDAIRIFHELDRLEKENWRMRVALQFYADEKNYNEYDVLHTQTLPFIAIKTLKDTE